MVANAMPVPQRFSTTADFEPLSQTATMALWCSCGAFALQAAFHWLRACCLASQDSSRTQQHELLSGAVLNVAAMLYLAMACGVSQDLYLDGGGGGHKYRIFFHLHFLERALAVGMVLVNTGALARERRPPTISLSVAWCSHIAALYFGHVVQPGWRRNFVLAVAVTLLVPLGVVLFGAMGARLRMSHLQVIFRFLASWYVLCGACFSLAFWCCAIAGLLSTETELLAYALLDYCVVGVSSLVISCAAGPEMEAGLLPAQEAELSLYPGPHSHGFYPNPHYYDDNL
eukprot:TRINITY_DN27557_c0_g1_i1.p1 TRINITY_DN27557_c0_g1~~TRINITY_DN27557_c0_g1_i1.p1  ORF type:complete len:286 (+),score=38.61 TRINITY_DN27557_c0_g1_i1:148-1005(+)